MRRICRDDASRTSSAWAHTANMDLHAENPHLAHAARRVPLQKRRGRGHLRRQGEEPALARPLLSARGLAGQRQNRLADARGGRCRLHPGRQRSTKRSRSKTTSSSSASRASTSCCATTRPTPTSSSRWPTAIPRSSSPAACARTAAPTTVPIFPAISRYRIADLLHRMLPVAQLQGRSLALPPAPLPAVLHQALPRPLRRRTSPRRRTTAKPCATRSCSSKAASRSWAARSKQRMEAAAGRRAVRTRGEISRPAHHRQPGAGEAAHRHRRQRRRGRLRLSLRKRHARRESLPHARRQDRRSPRVLLGGPVRSWCRRKKITRRIAPEAGAPLPERIQPARFLLCPAQAALHRSAYVPRSILVPVDFADRDALCHLLASAPGTRRDRRSAARRKALARRPRRPEREAKLRPALPRAAAHPEGDPGVAAGHPHASRAAPPHRVLRHLAHPGRGDGRLHGGVGRTAR